MTRTLRIALVDDQDLIYSDFRMILNAQKDMCVVGQASNGVGVLPMAKATQLGIVLMDIRMPALDRVSATRAALDSHPDLKVFILTAFDLDDCLVATVRAGASGFLPKGSTAHKFLAGICVMARGDSVIAPLTTCRLLERWFAPTGSTAGSADPSKPDAGTAHTESIDTLFDRGKEIVILVGHAISNTEIARHLALVESAAKSRLSRILHKLELRDRAQFIVLAYEGEPVRMGG